MLQDISQNETLTKSLRQISAGDYLFRQGDLGSVMYIVLQGTVDLYHRVAHEERWIGSLGSGEILGEKALFRDGTYRRTHTAIAKTSLVFLEVDKTNWKTIQANLPEFSFKMLNMLSDRLDRSNELISILQSVDPAERVVQFLLHVSRFQSRRAEDGQEIELTSKEIGLAINLNEEIVGEYLDELIRSKALRRTENSFVILNPALLEEQCANLREVVSLNAA